MKRALLIISTLLAVCNLWAQDVIIERPPFRVSNQTFIEVEQITISDTATVVKMIGYNSPGWWIKIIADTYIEADGKKHVVKYANNIVLGAETNTNDQGEHHFSLTFDPIPKNTKKITLVEEESIIQDIELQSKTATRANEVPAKFLSAINNLKDDGKSLPLPQLIDGKAILKGQFGEYLPNMNEKIEVFVNNALTGAQDEYTATVNADGSFTCEIPVPYTMEILFRTKKINDWIVVSPNKESKIFIDLYQEYRQQARLRTDKSEELQTMYFAGENAEINNQRFSPKYKEFQKKHNVDYDQMLSDVSGMDLTTFKDYHLAKMNAALQALEQMNLTKKMKELSIIDAKLSALYWIRMGDYFLESAFRKANNIDYKDELIGFTRPNFSDDFFNFIKDFPINDSESLYSHEYSYLVSWSRTLANRNGVSFSRITNEMLDEIVKDTNPSADDKEAVANIRKYDIYENYPTDSIKQLILGNQTILQKMLDSELLKPEQEEVTRRVINITDFSTGDKIHDHMEGVMTVNHLVSRDSIFQKLELPYFRYSLVNPSTEDSVFVAKRIAFYDKNEDKINSIFSKRSLKKSMKPIADILDTDKGILFDLMVCQSFLNKIEDYTPLDESDFTRLALLDNPFYASYAKRINNDLLAKIEENKKNQYNVYDLPETEEEQILHEIIKPFEGKVIFIDFWATWCGPCLSAMRQFADTKKSFADKDVVFIYLTDHSSPKTTWDNMIPSIGGEHYRLKDEQFAYLRTKFGAKGVPSYLILNRKGENVYFRVGFEGANVIAKKLDEELEKQL